MVMDIKPEVDIVKKVIETKKKEQRVYPCRSNRASQLGHPCERYLVYMRTAWEQKAIPPVEKEFIFDGGRVIEKLALEELEKAGFELSNQGRDFEDKRLGITGHVDTMLRVNGHRIPCEIKGISPFEFDKIDTAKDMLKSKKHYIRAYPAQLQLYMYLSNCEKGLFYIKNKLTYKPKEIWMALDYEYCEELLQKAERINQHLEKGTLPDRIEDYDLCMECDFKHICLPDLKKGEGLEVIDNAELQELLDRMEELKEAYGEYQAIEKKVKKMVEGKEKLICGEWLITGKYITKKIPPQPEKEITYWQKKIIKIE